MVLLVPSAPLLTAIKLYNSLPQSSGLSGPEIDPIPLDPSPPEYVDHRTVKKISDVLLHTSPGDSANQYRLNSLLRGCAVYIPPKPPKPEPTEEYKALMHRLRLESEECSYRSLLHPTDPALTLLSSQEEEYTLKDLRSDLSLIANVLFSVLATGGAVWAVASSWAVPERLALAFIAAIAVAIAEVVVLSGYYRRIEEAKALERKKVEKKEVIRTWTVGGGKKEGKKKSG
ncbi:endoplasmic reticulum-based factor for assembly of V-ATPase-domain-containing protein [Kalaharituber pfeilii]|nr:endoplasmic reticulum-based factor for assembly of V-ATPase-domain-containing protein [Kalaharituber pfeilii]